MKPIAALLFESNLLKSLPRSGYQYLGSGKESVAEHSFSTAVIAFVMAEMTPEADSYRLVAMSLMHDLPESRIGDLNTVHKEYVTADLQGALRDATRDLPFGSSLAGLIDEFEDGRTLEARLARDADQLALVVELKMLLDQGYRPARKWMPHVLERIQTALGKRLADEILQTDWDAWWMNKLVDNRLPDR